MYLTEGFLVGFFCYINISLIVGWNGCITTLTASTFYSTVCLQFQDTIEGLMILEAWQPNSFKFLLPVFPDLMEKPQQ